MHRTRRSRQEQAAHARLLLEAIALSWSSVGGALFSLVREGEILELKLLRARAGVAEALVEEVADESGLQVIEVVFAVAAIADEAGHAHEGQVMANRGVGLAEQVAQRRDVQLAVVSERDEDFQARLVRHELEYFRQAVDGLVGNLDRGGARSLDNLVIGASLNVNRGNGAQGSTLRLRPG